MSKEFKLPQGTRVYAIGDIHGFADVLVCLHEKIEADKIDRPIDRAVIVYLGDYIDRGPDSKGVIDQLLQREKENTDFEHVFLFGNHENGILDFMKGPKAQLKDFMHWGGAEAVESYGLEIDRKKLSCSEEPFYEEAEALCKAMPKAHLDFYNRLKLFHLEGDYLFVHAGMKPNVALEDQEPVDLFYTRQPFMSHEDLHEYYVVHGHTATRDQKVDIRPNRINLDTGLYDGGPLSCGVFENGEGVRLLQSFGENER